MAYHFENLKLEKGMYQQAGKSFVQVLEEQDPSEHYRNTPMEGLDAYQRQLKRFDIKVKGPNSDVVEKFFSTSQAAVLFPEYIARSVRQGLGENNVLEDITAVVTQFEGMDYRSIQSAPSENDRKLKIVSEGARIPETQVTVRSHLVELNKRGRMLVASYEALRFQRLDVFSVMLRQMGGYIARMHLIDAVNAIVDGDGNENPAQAFTIGTDPVGGVAGTLSYEALLDFWAQFAPYEMNTMLVSSDVMLAMLKLPEFQNPLTGLNFQGTGSLSTPLGAKLIRTDVLPAGTIIGLDKRYALEMIRSGDVMVEYDKLIDQQLERAAITTIAGYARLIDEAAMVLNVGTAAVEGEG